METKITRFWMTSETCTWAGEKRVTIKKTQVLLALQQNLGNGVTYKALMQWEDFVFELNENEQCSIPVEHIMALLEIRNTQLLLLGGRGLGKLVCQLNTNI